MFCRGCGKELPENAAVCPACGKEVRSVDDGLFNAGAPVAPPMETKGKPVLSPEEKYEIRQENICRISKVFSVVGLCFAGASLVFFVLGAIGFITLQYSSVNYAQTSQLLYGLGEEYSTSFGGFAVLFGIAAFVLGLIQKKSSKVCTLSVVAFAVCIGMSVLSGGLTLLPYALS